MRAPPRSIRRRSTSFAPAQASAAGFNTLAFSDDFTSATTIAPSGSSASGYNWYWNFGITTPIWSVNTSATAASISNGNVGGGSHPSPDGGILTINNTNTSGSGNLAVLISLPGRTLNTGTSSDVLPPVGQGHWGQYGYFEAYVQFQRAGNISSSPSNGWPAFFCWDAQSLRQFGFGSSLITNTSPTEVDIFENFGSIDFGGGPSTPNEIHSTLWNHSATSFNTQETEALNDDNWHSIGCLWTPTTVGFYLDNSLIQGSISISPNYIQINSQTLFLAFSDGNSWQFNIDWVRVWTAP